MAFLLRISASINVARGFSSKLYFSPLCRSYFHAWQHIQCLPTFQEICVSHARQGLSALAVAVLVQRRHGGLAGNKAGPLSNPQPVRHSQSLQLWRVTAAVVQASRWRAAASPQPLPIQVRPVERVQTNSFLTNSGVERSCGQGVRTARNGHDLATAWVRMS